MFETLEKRYEFVKQLGGYVAARFSEPYNIFVFGSFLTDDFVPGKSDLDLGIYAEKKISELDGIIEEFLSNYNLDHDIIWIQTGFSTNYIDIAALQGYKLTDYYPEKLLEHFVQLILAFQIELENREIYKEMFRFALKPERKRMRELQDMNAFGYTTTKNVNRFTFEEALAMMKENASACLDAYDMSIKTKDDMIAQMAIDACVMRFNTYVEAFKDIYTMYCAIKKGRIVDTLRSCADSFRKEVDLSDEGSNMLDFLINRNKLVHLYYNMEFMKDKLREALKEHSDGMLDIYDSLYDLIDEANLLEYRIKK